MKSKKCTKCLKRKPLEAFSSCRLVKDRKASWCRACTSTAAKVCRTKKPEHYRRYAQLYTAANPLIVIYKNMKKANTARGHGKLRVTYSYLRQLFKEQGGKCYWSGRPMKNSGKLTDNPEAVSADRLDLSKPYVIGNVVLCCRWANFGRHTTPIEAWIRFLKSIGLKGLWSCS